MPDPACHLCGDPAHLKDLTGRPYHKKCISIIGESQNSAIHYVTTTDMSTLLYKLKTEDPRFTEINSPGLEKQALYNHMSGHGYSGLYFSDPDYRTRVMLLVDYIAEDFYFTVFHNG